MKKPSSGTQTASIPMLVKAAFFSTCCFSISGLAFAEGGQYSAAFPATPGFTVMGLTGTNSTGYADAMLPLLGAPTTFVYIDPQFLLSDDYTASLGAGFRYLNDTVGILGAYVFADYNHSPNSNNFWFVSPGIERLGDIVDFSANLYIPVSEQSETLSTTTGQALGTDNYITFQQHAQYDGLFTTFESVGVGADAEIGFHIPAYTNPKFYVGGYYFNPQDADDDITGVTARLELPLNDRFTFLLSDGYDNEEGNTFKLGVSFNFGGRKTSKSYTNGHLAERMVDPIHRNLIAISGSSKTGQPIVETQNQLTGLTIIKNQIAFFDIDALPGGDGTYERPFNLFNQTNVDAANAGSNINLYVNTGTYAPGSIINLTGDNLYGRQDYNGNAFFQAAIGDNRPLFEFTTTGFNLIGNNSSSFDSVMLTGNGTGNGINITNPADQSMLFSINNSEVSNFNNALVAVNNVGSSLEITSTDSSFDGNINDAVFITNSGTAAFNATNSSFDGNGGYGIVLNMNSNSMTTLNTTNSSFNEDFFRGGLAVAQGSNSTFIFNANGSSFDGDTTSGFALTNPPAINNSNVAILNLTNSTFNGADTRGLIAANSGMLTINATNSSFSNISAGAGLAMTNIAGGTMTLNAINSIFDGNVGSSGVLLTNNVATGTATFNATNSTFNGNTGGGGDGVNFLNTGIAIANITDSNFNNNSGSGFFLNSTNGQTATITINNSTFNGNLDNNGGLNITNATNAVLVNPIITVNATASSFENNVGYGVFGQNTFVAPAVAATPMSITLTNSTFLTNTLGNTNQAALDNITWTITP